MSRSKLTIMNMALAASGQPGKEITEASTGPEFALMERWYPDVVAECFEDEPFYFGKERVSLTNRSAGDFGYVDKWLLPTNVLQITRVFVNDYDTEDWQRDDEYLYIDASSGVDMEYIVSGAEHRWSATFAIAVARKLEALLRHGINEEFEEAEMVMRNAGFGLVKAGIHSSKQHRPRRPFRKGFLMRSRTHGPLRYRSRPDGKA